MAHARLSRKMDDAGRIAMALDHAGDGGAVADIDLVKGEALGARKLGQARALQRDGVVIVEIVEAGDRSRRDRAAPLPHGSR